MNLSMINKLERQKSINEATFYGKNKLLIRGEEIIADIQTIMTESISKKGFNADLTKRYKKCMYLLEDVLCQAFGFSHVYINDGLVVNSARLINTLDTARNLITKGVIKVSYDGCTIPTGYLIKYTEAVIGKRKVKVFDLNHDIHKITKFDEHSDVAFVLMIDPDMFITGGGKSLTPSEIMAVILHEIGHNFYYGPVRELASIVTMLPIDNTKNLINTMLLIADVHSGNYLLNKLDDRLKDSNIRPFEDLSIKIASNCASTFGVIYNQLRSSVFINNAIMTYMYISQILTAPIALTSFVRTVTGVFIKYDTEKFADAFAVSYGYGADLNIALEKLAFRMAGNIGNMVNDKKIYTYTGDYIMTIARIPMMLLNPVLDCHGSNITRLNNSYKYLRSCGDSITDPELKKEYIDSLHDLETLYEDTKEYRGMQTTKLTNAEELKLQEFFNISDIKELTSTLDSNKFGSYKNLDFK